MVEIASFGKCLREARRAHNLTQDELARRAKVSRNTISALETGSFSELGIMKLRRICMIVHLEIRVGPCVLDLPSDQAEAFAAAAAADARIALAKRKLSQRT